MLRRRRSTTPQAIPRRPLQQFGSTPVTWAEPLECRVFLSASFQGLGGLRDLHPDYPIATPEAISADGSVVYGNALPPSDVVGGRPVLFRWTRPGGVTLPAGARPGPSDPDQSQLIGTLSFTVKDVSPDGAVAVGTVASPLSESAGFRWSDRSGLEFISPLSTFSNVAAEVWNTSADGSVVVGGRRYPNETYDDLTDDGLEAFRWTPGGGLEGLGSLPGRPLSWGGNPFTPLLSDAAVSADGSVVVGIASSDLITDRQAFRWTATTGMVSIGDAESAAVSADGTAIIGWTESAAGPEAYRWTEAGGMQFLGDLPGGGYGSKAIAVSADGSVVVGVSLSELGPEVFRWTAAGMQALGVLGGGIFAFRDMSADGSVIVGSTESARGTEPFVWDVAHGKRTLQSVLAEAGVDIAGWNLADVPPPTRYPLRISADGTTVIGMGRNPNGALEGWVATLPGHDVPPATVLARQVFYNHSGFDGNDVAANAADDAAVATDKAALLPDQAPTFANVTSFSHGLNGIMVDIANLPAGGVLTPDDFDIGGDGTRVVGVVVRRGAGVNDSDRVSLTWPDYDTPTDPPSIAVGNGWLRVTVKANANTGLSQPDVFSFGNLIGETGDGTGAATLRVNALDLGAVKRELNAASGITGRYDFNRDGKVNALDLGAVKANLNRSLALANGAEPAMAPPLPAAPAPKTEVESAAAALLAAGGSREVL